MKKVIVSLLVIILIAAVGVGGWYLWDSLQKEKSKTGELENKTAQLENKLNELGNNKENNQSSENDTESNSTTDKEPKSFTKKDLTFNGVGLGDTLANALATYGENCDMSSQKEEASGSTEYTYTYKDGLVVKGLCSGEAFDEGSIREIILSQNLKTVRNIGIGSTVDDIKKAYPSNSILTEDNDTIVVGFPGDNDEYSSEGRIYFSIKQGKVTEIRMLNSYGE